MSWLDSAHRRQDTPALRRIMNEIELQALLEQVKSGEIHPDDAHAQLRRLPFADLGHSRIDHHRNLRQGLPEAIYGPGKTPPICVQIVAELLTNGSGPVVLTRADDAQIEAVSAAHDGALVVGRTVIWRAADPVDIKIVVAAAGTADLPVAEECDAVLAAHGVDAIRLTDIGVAGLHRLLAEVDTLAEADIVITIAGMEGALATAVGGITGAPVIAVPTSVGYGAGLEGVTALLSMLASCASGVTVVGIDNGFGAAIAALRILGVRK
ncbi:MAG: NCAIR mutase (PurE)-related protein [Candidatus Poriferisodalaceae bacterium]